MIPKIKGSIPAQHWNRGGAGPNGRAPLTFKGDRKRETPVPAAASPETSPIETKPAPQKLPGVALPAFLDRSQHSCEQLLSPPSIPLTALGGAVINAASLPQFVADRKDDRSNYVSFALFQTNERFDAAREAFPGLALDGCFVGVGFGASFLCLDSFFRPSFPAALFCDREPFVYLLGKIFLSLLRSAERVEEVYLSFLNVQRFARRYLAVIAAEPAGSPIFLRHSREELLREIPFEIDHLRVQVLLGESRRPKAEEEPLFRSFSEDAELLAAQQHWLIDAWPKRMQYIGKIFYRNFARRFDYFRSIAEKITPLCVDIFHPDFWTYLESRSDLWQKPSMIYFSNAAVYSMGAAKRGSSTSTTYHYDDRVIHHLVGTTGAKLVCGFTKPEGQYTLHLTREIPSGQALVQSFRSR